MSVSSSTSPQLETAIFGFSLENPLILGSGTLIEHMSDVAPFLEAGAGAVVPRTTRKIMTRKSNPVPHLYQGRTSTAPFMLNAEWTGPAIEYWREYLGCLSDTRKVIMSVSGRDIQGCKDVCNEIDRAGTWPYIEINVSCAHSNDVHGMITRNRIHIETLVKTIKDSGVTTPIAVKLGHSDAIVPLSQLAKEAGADGIVAINTFGPVFDFEIDDDGNPRSVLGIQGAKGGLSGPPIFHIALTDIAAIKSQVDIPVIGCGGVNNARDVIKFLMAGADAVQIYTAAHIKGQRAPEVFSEIRTELLEFMTKKGLLGIESLKGRALSLLHQETNLNVNVPSLVPGKCISCRQCINICLKHAISSSLDKTDSTKISPDSCVGCGHCVSVCPQNALQQSF